MKVDTILKKLKNQNFRLTKARIDLIQLLADKPMNIHMLEQSMKSFGHPNIQTVYNNINFLLEQNIIFVMLENQDKIYHLVDLDDEATTNINMKCHANQELFHISNKKTIETIRKTLGLGRFQINHLDITIQGQCKAIDEDHCELQDTCILKEIAQRHISNSHL